MRVLSNGEDYVTYLPKGKVFDRSKLFTNLYTNYINNKPILAWWGSPVTAKYGWRDWCEDNEFGNYEFLIPIIWHFKKGTPILEITLDDVKNFEKSDMAKYTVRYRDSFSGKDRLQFNYSAMANDGIVAVKLADPNIGHYYYIDTIEEEVAAMFYTWDCESIVVLDSDKIKFGNK